MAVPLPPISGNGTRGSKSRVAHQAFSSAHLIRNTERPSLGSLFVTRWIWCSAAVFLLSVVRLPWIGPGHISLDRVLARAAPDYAILIELRVSRTLPGLLGVVLSRLPGSLFQSMLRDSLASPYTLWRVRRRGARGRTHPRPRSRSSPRLSAVWAGSILDPQSFSPSLSQARHGSAATLGRASLALWNCAEQHLFRVHYPDQQRRSRSPLILYHAMVARQRGVRELHRARSLRRNRSRHISHCHLPSPAWVLLAVGENWGRRAVSISAASPSPAIAAVPFSLPEPSR